MSFRIDIDGKAIELLVDMDYEGPTALDHEYARILMNEKDCVQLIDALTKALETTEHNKPLREGKGR